MKQYIRQRLLYLLPVLLGITLLTFLLMQLPSDDAVDMMYRQSGAVSEEVKAAARAELGLDKPVAVQYISWLGHILTGDAGRSFISGQEVSGMFWQRLPATVVITTGALFLTLLFSIPLGLLCGVRRNGAIDYLLRCLTFMGNSLPGFFIAFILLYVFALKLRLLPVMSDGSAGSYILPCLTLALPMTAKYTRYVREGTISELAQPYVVCAKMRGISFRRVLMQYVLKANLLTLTTLLALSLGSLLGGTAIVEMIFSIEGIGKMAVDAISMKDYPVIQAYVIWTSFIFTLVNLLADIAYHWLDPRIRYQGKEVAADD